MRKRFAVVWPPLALLTAAFLAYHNSFSTPFIFDGTKNIRDNPKIRALWPLWELFQGSARPLTRFTFAINYALGKTSVTGYHVVNFVIHVLASCVLYGLVHRTLLSLPPQSWLRRSASGIALSTALFWVAHPLQSESVTYVFQRAESLMGLFYLLTLYALARALSRDATARPWKQVSVLACFLGMASKAVMVTAPLIAFFYDRAFWGSSWKKIWHQRKIYYLGLISTWVILMVVACFPHESRSSVGWTLRYVKPIPYFLTQCEIILHYLKLCFWPSDLVLDYVWPPVSDASTVLIPLALVFILAGGAVWFYLKHPKAGFPGVWFLGILLPTSSFFPVADLAVEHRMYLPLAAVVFGTIVMGAWILKKVSSSERSERFLKGMVVVGITVALALRTAERNLDYRSHRAMWQKVAQQRPENPRAHANLGVALERRGQVDEALDAFKRAAEVLTRRPSQSVELDTLYSNFAGALIEKGRLTEAIFYARQALKVNPMSASARGNLAVALMLKGRWAEAKRELAESISIKPDNPAALRLQRFMQQVEREAGSDYAGR